MTGLKSLKLPTESDDLDTYMRERGLPVMAPSHTTQPIPDARKIISRGAPNVKMAIEVPDYLPAQLRRLALDRNCTIRHIVLEALAKDGCDIAPEDRTKDGRRPTS